MDRLTKPFAWFLRIEALGGGVLLLSTVAALVLSNSPWAHAFASVWERPVGVRIGSFDFVRSSREWISDGLMTLFFFVVALELEREWVLGELRNPREAAFSIVAALAGLLAGIGFTKALFIGDLALPDASIDSAKLGILSAPAVCAAAGLGQLTSKNRTIEG